MTTKLIFATMFFASAILLAANEATWALVILNATIALAEVQAKVTDVAEKVEVVHKATNSLVTQAVAGGKLEGEIIGAERERTRSDQVAADQVAAVKPKAGKGKTK